MCGVAKRKSHPNHTVRSQSISADCAYFLVAEAVATPNASEVGLSAATVPSALIILRARLSDFTVVDGVTEFAITYEQFKVAVGVITHSSGDAALDIPASRHATGTDLPCADATSICRSSVTICSELNLYFGMTKLLSKPTSLDSLCPKKPGQVTPISHSVLCYHSYLWHNLLCTVNPEFKLEEYEIYPIWEM